MTSRSKVPVYKIKTKEMMNSGFDLLPLRGSSLLRSYDPSDFHRHSFFELFYFEKGGGEHEIDFLKYPVRTRSVHFVAPGQVHCLTLNSSEGFVICFTEEFCSLPQQGLVSERFPFFDNAADAALSLQEEQAAAVSQQLQLLKRAWARKQAGYEEIMRSYLNLILLTLRQAALINQPEKKTKEKKNIVTAFRRLVNREFLNDLRVADYAAALHISPNYLNSLCRKHEGKTATKIIQDRILLEAKRLLYSTDLSVKEIAYELHFEDAGYFIRLFKKQTGSTPVLYREATNKYR